MSDPRKRICSGLTTADSRRNPVLSKSSLQTIPQQILGKLFLWICGGLTTQQTLVRREHKFANKFAAAYSWLIRSRLWGTLQWICLSPREKSTWQICHWFARIHLDPLGTRVHPFNSPSINYHGKNHTSEHQLQSSTRLHALPVAMIVQVQINADCRCIFMHFLFPWMH